MRQFYRIVSFLIFIIFPFGQFTKIPITVFGLPEVNFYIFDVLVGAFVGVYLVDWMASGKKFNKSQLFFLPFVTIALLSLILTPLKLELMQYLVSSLYLIRWLVYSLLIIVFVGLAKRDNQQFNKDNLICFLGIIGTMTAVFGLIQYFLWPDLEALTYFQYDPHFHRLAGTFFDPNFIGIILVLTIILLLFSNLQKFGKIKQYWLSHLQLLLTTVALVLTYSRSSYIALLVVILLISWFKNSVKLIILLLGVGFISWLVLPFNTGGEGVNLLRTSTISSRVGSWQQALNIGLDHPILGVGFNAYRYTQVQYGYLTDNWQESHSGAGVESSWLFIFATTGIAGLLAYLFFWAKLLGIKREIGDKRDKNSTRLILISLAAVATHSLFINSLFYPWVMFWLAVLISTMIIQRNLS